MSNLFPLDLSDVLFKPFVFRQKHYDIMNGSQNENSGILNSVTQRLTQLFASSSAIDNLFEKMFLKAVKNGETYVIEKKKNITLNTSTNTLNLPNNTQHNNVRITTYDVDRKDQIINAIIIQKLINSVIENDQEVALTLQNKNLMARVPKLLGCFRYENKVMIIEDINSSVKTLGYVLDNVNYITYTNKTDGTKSNEIDSYDRISNRFLINQQMCLTMLQLHNLFNYLKTKLNFCHRNIYDFENILMLSEDSQIITIEKNINNVNYQVTIPSGIVYTHCYLCNFMNAIVDFEPRCSSIRSFSGTLGNFYKNKLLPFFAEKILPVFALKASNPEIAQMLLNYTKFIFKEYCLEKSNKSNEFILLPGEWLEKQRGANLNENKALYDEIFEINNLNLFPTKIQMFAVGVYAALLKDVPTKYICTQPLKFDKMNSLSQGGFGKVFQANRIGDNDTNYVIKTIQIPIPHVSATTSIDLIRSEYINYIYFMETCLDYICSLECIYIDEQNKTLNIVQKYCGNTLDKELLIKNSTISNKQKLKWCAQFLNGLKCIHDKGLVHYDIKPQNLVVDNNKIKFIDFGSVAKNEKGRVYTEDFVHPSNKTTYGRIIFNIKNDYYAAYKVVDLILNEFNHEKKDKLLTLLRGEGGIYGTNVLDVCLNLLRDMVVTTR